MVDLVIRVKILYDFRKSNTGGEWMKDKRGGGMRTTLLNHYFKGFRLWKFINVSSYFCEKYNFFETTTLHLFVNT